MQLICERNCGFRVHERYFVQKKRFQAGICPRCAGPIGVVEDFTDTRIPGLRIISDPTQGNYGEVVKAKKEA